MARISGKFCYYNALRRVDRAGLCNGVREGLTIQQTFLLTTGVWLTLPLFGAIPFVFGATEARFVDAFFEAMSGLTTTGSTVFSGLEELPKGLLLWRGIRQWLGGIGIIVVAMVFLPDCGSGVCRFSGPKALIPLGKFSQSDRDFKPDFGDLYWPDAGLRHCLYQYRHECV